MLYIQTLVLAFSLLMAGCKADKITPTPENPAPADVPEPLEIGYSVPVGRVTLDKMNSAAKAGIKYIEASGMNPFITKSREMAKTDEETREIMTSAYDAASKAGVEIWSIHMPYSEHMDLSTIDEADRKKVVAAHKQLLEYLKILKPKIILFHPSYYLDPPNQRDMRKSQMIKSAIELNEAVRAIGAEMVIENMLGPELMVGARERPLMRTVEETVEIFNRLPDNIYSAIDMNHIKNPENLIRAMGKRLKTVHIADGTGMAEDHFFPCSGEGKNNWVEILKALDEVGYKGPFVFESAYDSEQALADCYQSLYQKFIATLK